MQLSIDTYNGTAINDVANFEAYFPAGTPVMPKVSLEWVKRNKAFPKLASKNFDGATITIGLVCKGTIHTQLQTLEKLFAEDDFTLHKLIVKDKADSDRQWYLNCYAAGPVTLDPDYPGSYFVTLAIDEPFWRVNTPSIVAGDWHVTASGQTQNVTTLGNKQARPIITIKPTNARGGGYTYQRCVIVYNNTDLPLANYKVDVTGGGLDTAALIAGSKMLASGDDFIAVMDGVPANRWLNGINTAATQMWINATFKPRVELTLKTAISNVGTPATINFAVNAANKAKIAKLPAAGTFLIENELWNYSGLNKKKCQATVVQRAVNGTAAASHAAGLTVRWIEHVIWMLYGNSVATTPSTDDSLKPIFELNSTMASRIFNSFYDADTLRGGWSPARISALGPNSNFYTGSHEADADPATEMGETIQAFNAANIWKPETAEIEWRAYDPAGFTTITVTGAKFRQSASWPAVVACEVSRDGVKWTTIFNEATPASLTTWAALSSHAGVSLGGTWPYVRFHMQGSVAAAASNKASWEAQSVTLVAGANVPTIALGAEIANQYYIDSQITNNTNGEYIQIACPIPLNGTLTINCDAMTATFQDGNNAFPYLTISQEGSEEWLPLEPGVTNELQYDEVGVTAETIGVSWEDRNTL